MEDYKNKIIQGDCLEVLKEIPDNTIDTIITDPPYGLSFMGKKWDYDVPSVEIWKEALRVLKPGGTALVFAGGRTQHRMAVNVEDAGFELKDTIMWLYSSGFPKAHDISKAIDKKAGAKEAQLWEGWKSHALKPAYEPILVAVKPNDGTYANNALKWGVSGLNIDESRVAIPEDDKANYDFNNNGLSRMSRLEGEKLGQFDGGWKIDKTKRENSQGRFPANVILECTCETEEHTNPDCPCYILDQQSGGASRFFYVAKVSKSERNRGCEGLEEKEEVYPGINTFDESGNRLRADGSVIPPLKSKNNHPTVKPLKLMEYLCTITKTPTSGIVLDMFAGSGTTGLACQNIGRDYLLIEREPEYVEIIKARLEGNKTQGKLLEI